ncbi:MAG: hypothetical protein D6736_11925 [Nitrospinota bacterium]|nr:MAG: hypothetical protein D6736_11925 [Nitrospinota bacterium]
MTLGICFTLALFPALLLAYGGVYTLTKHGDPLSGVQRDVSLPRGDCNQCHLPHSGYPFFPFADHTNALCYSCHNGAGALQIYQGQAVYDLSTHATSASMVWPSPPPARQAGDWGECVNCHNPHGYKDGTGLVPHMVWRREENLCKECHDGSPASDVYTEIGKVSSHPVTTYSGRHAADEGGDSSKFGTANRHAECVDCHNPHWAKTDSPSPPDASSRLKGVSRIVVGLGRTLTYTGPADTTAVKEYEICYKCHSSWTTLPAGTTDKAAEFDPANGSFHPVEAVGKNTDIDSRTLVAPLTATSQVYCTDCHTSDNTGVRGPHGSIYAPILKKAYFTGDNSSPPSTDVCFDCHVSTQYLTDTRASNSTYTHFRDGTSSGSKNFHYVHTVKDAQTSCKTCHYNIHGTTSAHLIVFNTAVVSSSGGQIRYEHRSDGGACTLKCHGKDHNPKSYRWK